MADLSRMGDVLSRAETLIVGTHVHDAHGLTGIVGQTAHVKTLSYIGLRSILYPHLYILRDNLVDAVFERLYLLLRERDGKMVVELGLLALYMCREGTAAVVSLIHQSVE